MRSFSCFKVILSPVFKKSIIVMCLDVNFFGWLCSRFAYLLGTVHSCLLLNLGSFLLFFKYSFGSCLFFFFFLLGHQCTNVGSFVIFPLHWTLRLCSVFFFFSQFSLFFFVSFQMEWNLFLCPQFTEFYPVLSCSNKNPMRF